MNEYLVHALQAVPMRWQFVLFFAAASVLITVASGFVYSKLLRSALETESAASNQALVRSISVETVEALRLEQPAALQEVLENAAAVDPQILRIAFEGDEPAMSAEWSAIHPAGAVLAAPFVAAVTVGDETVGRMSIERDLSSALADIERSASTIYWVVGIALAAISLTSIVATQIFILRPVAALRHRLENILRDPAKDHLVSAHSLMSREIRQLESAAGRLRTALAKGQEDESRLRIATDQAVMANRAKSEFLANMSHELRTPLNSIIGFSEMIMHERIGELGNAKYAEYAGDIHGSGSHLLQIINDILDLSKVEAGKLDLRKEKVDVDHMTSACLSIVRERAREKEIDITTYIHPGLPPLLADELRVRQALINLVGNAIKFTPEGGSVIVEAAQTDDAQPYLKVMDNGIGIAAEDIEKAMGPFGQADGALNRRFDGSGLGLPLTKALVELHYGQFEIDSTEGVGTTVTLTFPQDPCAPHDTPDRLAPNLAAAE